MEINPCLLTSSVFSHGACPFQGSSATLPDCGVCDWREAHGTHLLSMVPKNQWRARSLARSGRQQTSAVKHLPGHANVTWPRPPQLDPQAFCIGQFLAPISFPEDLLLGREN